MDLPDQPSRIRRMLDARLKQLGQAGPMLAASLVEQRVRCGTAGCRCQRGHKHVKHALTRTVEGKTQTVYVPQDLVEDVRAWVAEHKRIKQVLKDISDLSVALVRTHVAARRPGQARAARPD